MKNRHFDVNDLSKYPSIILDKRTLCDYELIVNKAFLPLEGFMDKDNYESCVNNMRLTCGKVWPIPITLSINESQKDKMMHCDYVILKHETGLPLGYMNISSENSIYKPDLQNEFVNVFGCDDDNHPYISLMKKKHEEGYIYNIGGRIENAKLPPHYDFNELRMSPNDVKDYFKKNGWNRIVAFQTRNPMHRSHYELTQYALKVAGDNSRLFLNPVVGITQDCDVNYSTRVKCYKELMPYYEKDTSLLNLLPLSMRMAGPREAVWHAIIRKNYGCTHFIVGRDHAGPSYKKKDGTDFYGPYDAQNLLSQYAEEIGIILITSKMIVYSLPNNEKNEMKGKYLPIDEVDQEKNKIMKISGTQQREMLKNGTEIPEWFTFPKISKILKDSYLPLDKQGFTLYFVGLSGSGKSTIANFVIAKLNELTNRNISYLDGDIVRLNLSQGLGFSLSDRSINVRRIGFVCSEITKHGGIAVAANIAPIKEDREYNRSKISDVGNYIEIFVNSSLDTCEKRDAKGLYQLARRGIIKDFTGINSKFDIPNHPEIILEDKNSISDNVSQVIKYLQQRRLI